MNTPLALILGMSSLALAGTVRAATTFDEAPVLASTPIYHVVESRQPRQECWEEDVVREVRHHESRTPNILGAIVGGALGNAVGHNKSNKRVGAAVGAILGGSIGGDIARNARRNDGYYVETRERCRTVYTSVQEEKLVGYDVLYSYNGAQHTVRMPQDPGATVRVRVNVEPVL